MNFNKGQVVWVSGLDGVYKRFFVGHTPNSTTLCELSTSHTLTEKYVAATRSVFHTKSLALIDFLNYTISLKLEDKDFKIILAAINELVSLKDGPESLDRLLHFLKVETEPR